MKVEVSKQPLVTQQTFIKTPTTIITRNIANRMRRREVGDLRLGEEMLIERKRKLVFMDRTIHDLSSHDMPLFWLEHDDMDRADRWSELYKRSGIEGRFSACGGKVVKIHKARLTGVHNKEI